MKKIVISILKGYHYGVSPFLPKTCRFVPTCSEYAVAAFEKHGLRRGFILALKRIARCHPFHVGGYDPVK